MYAAEHKINLTNPSLFKTETFNSVDIGNNFYYKGELFVKMNPKQAIGEVRGYGLLKNFNESQYVTVQI